MISGQSPFVSGLAKMAADCDDMRLLVASETDARRKSRSDNWTIYYVVRAGVGCYGVVTDALGREVISSFFRGERR